MGLALDIYVEFFFRTIVNLTRRIGTSKWPVLTAIVAKSERQGGMGCIVIAGS
jgi:hypothetical protein